MVELDQPTSLDPDSVPTEVVNPLPHSVEAEQSVLGALMQDSKQFDSVVEILGVADFYQSPHRKIFSEMGLKPSTVLNSP